MLRKSLDFLGSYIFIELWVLGGDISPRSTCILDESWMLSGIKVPRDGYYSTNRGC